MGSPGLTIIDAIIFSGVFYGMLISIRLFISSVKYRHNLYLGFLMLGFSLINWRVLLIVSTFDNALPWLSLSSPVTILAIMPSLYLYLTAIVAPGRNSKAWLHYIPFIIHLFYQSIRFIPGSWKDLWHQQGYFMIASFLLSILFIGQILFYSFRIFPLIRSIESLLKKKFSDIEKISLSWLRSLFFACTGVFFLWAIGMFFTSLFTNRIAEFSVLFISISILVYWIGTHGMMKGYVYNKLAKNIDQQDMAEEETSRAKDLINKIKSDELFLIPQLQVGDVAKKYDLPTKEVSSLLNKGLNKNFYQLINELRVDCFCENIHQAEQLSLLGLALQCGFHSKSVFNKFFKEYRKMTPREYFSRYKKGPDS